MKRIETVEKLVDKYFKLNNVSYGLEVSEDTLLYKIIGEPVLLMIRFQFFDKEDEKDAEEYCALVDVWLATDDDDEWFNYDCDDFYNKKFIVEEILPTALNFYKEKLIMINKIESKIQEINSIMSENDIEYYDSVDFKTFIDGN